MKLVNGKYIFVNHYERDNFLDDFPFMTNNLLSLKYKCSWRTVVRLARLHNLQKDELFRYQFDFRKWGALGALHANSIATRFLKGNHCSEATEFKPEHVPLILSRLEILNRISYKQLPAH